MRKTRPLSFDNPAPSDMSKCFNTTSRKWSASWPVGMTTAVRTGENLEAPRQHRRARGRSEFQMASEDIVEPLLHQHLERFAQAIEKIGGRRVRPRTALVLLDELLPIPIGPAHRVGLSCGESLLRYCIEAKPGGQHQPLL